MKRKLLVLAFTFLMILGLASCGQEEEIPAQRTEGWLSSDGSPVQLYTADIQVEENIFGKVKSRQVSFFEGPQMLRGTAVTLVDEPESDEEGNIIYEKIEIEGDSYYIKPGIFVTDYQSVVVESKKYVRTSVTIYENSEDAKIAGYAPKSSVLDVTGFDFLNEDASVNMYKVSFNGTEGYVFSKYLADDQASADAVYNEHGEADYHKDAIYPYYDLYGGDPAKLDWYPYEKPQFENNEFCSDARTMYLGVGCSYDIDSYIQVAKAYGVNAMCVDIKDDVIGFASDVAKELSPSTYANFTYYGADSYADMIKKIKDAGIYVIGRIVIAKDDYYAVDHPEDCYANYYGELWPSMYSRNLWYYKVSLALEAIEKFGFNEIQFDYVRFDETTWYKEEYGDGDFNNPYGEDKCEAVQNFVFYAADMIHRAGAYLSIDVFGESSYGYVPSYGQYWPAISNIADAISAMPYVDHFDNNPVLWEQPYNTLYNWACGAAELQKHIPTPASARTWITAYSVPYWYAEEDKIYYSAEEVSQQAQGLWDAGLTGGFLTWNVACDLYRYDTISWAWSKNYAGN